jgi:hypothetical protein
MIKAIANKKIDLSKEEFEYYKKLKETFGEDSFRGLFNTDNKGKITSITPSPSQPIAMVLIFFILNVMMNQRLRAFEQTMSKVSELEKKVEKLQKKVG